MVEVVTENEKGDKQTETREKIIQDLKDQEPKQDDRIDMLIRMITENSKILAEKFEEHSN